MIIDLLVIIFFLSFVFSARRQEYNVYKEPTEVSLGNPENGSVRKERENNFLPINEWIYQMNSSSNRETILSWYFVEGTSDEICFMTSSSGYYVRGKVYLKKERNQTRVSKCVYFDNGEIKSFRGFIPKSFSKDTLYNNFKSCKMNKEKLHFFDEVLVKSLEKGSAEFDLLKYENISADKFKRLFGQKELSAFRKMLLDDFETAEISDKEKHIFVVTPKVDFN